MSAARNGHVALVERLLPLMIDLSRNTTNYLLYWFNQVLKILDEGTVHGHLPVVEFMVQHASNNDYADRFLRWPTVNTLSKAILAGHLHVAEFLINQRVISWNLQDAFTVALDKGEMSLAERLREVYPQQMPGQNLFIDLASSGQLHALEYLYNNGCNDPELIGLAFTFAVTQALVIANVNLIKAHRQVVEFLLGTGCVTSEAFENTFKTACSENDYTCIDTVKLLYKWNRASPQCIDRAFGLANNFTVLKMLYENEKISEKAITGAFENAVRLQHKEHSDILLFLYKQPCIPSNLIEKAFLRAVKFLNAVYPGDGAKTKTRIVTCLRDDERLSSKAMGEAFVDAVKSCNKDMMTLLYDERRTPPEFLVKAFVEAVHRKETGLVKDILKLLTVEEYVPRELMHEIFVAAARHGQMLILELVCESLPADLPLEVLKNALDIAGGNHKIENYIRKMVCDQVFKEQA
ncbi:hypothetical protein V7S43_004650 [Phytophthora oleae]|uniref:Ankyrin repeat protein n=1 Tax=Phytophthora oleae TaxID=2107226 RepID=A0ABD3FXD1_9STRA